MDTKSAPISTVGIDCVCYLAKDLARARTFYELVMGLKPMMEADSWVEYGLPDQNSFALAKLPGDQWYQTGGAMFAVADIHAAFERLKEAGTTIHGDLMESPVCTMAWCDDTEGNNFAIHKRKG